MGPAHARVRCICTRGVSVPCGRRDALLACTLLQNRATRTSHAAALVPPCSEQCTDARCRRVHVEPMDPRAMTAVKTPRSPTPEQARHALARTQESAGPAVHQQRRAQLPSSSGDRRERRPRPRAWAAARAPQPTLALRDVLHGQAGRQALLELVSLLKVGDAKGVQVLGAPHLELHLRARLLDLDGLRVLPARRHEKLLDLADLLRLRSQRTRAHARARVA
eukprot:CAMPEP_0119410260 /NCGR_PEP_ID=MMETSP1335-20130426/3330_1 /TAXON_ID=259385 /ORGANISM="Chrysoculter rhomboideus, Strain RCC1486" /LENGTH=221 /DNA_ID=CAMNT_0007434757 /DNA_START=194 /DNA_END=856 /DNA_ORIENTATION=-